MYGGLPRFDFYPRDWILDTRDLTREQKGVYIDLLAAIYARGGPLPHQPNELRSLLGEKSIRVINRIVGELIERGKLHMENGWLFNNRAMEEIEAFHQRRTIAARGGHASKRRARTLAYPPRAGPPGAHQPLSHPDHPEIRGQAA